MRAISTPGPVLDALRDGKGRDRAVVDPVITRHCMFEDTSGYIIIGVAVIRVIIVVAVTVIVMVAQSRGT